MFLLYSSDAFSKMNSPLKQRHFLFFPHIYNKDLVVFTIGPYSLYLVTQGDILESSSATEFDTVYTGNRHF